MNSDIIKAFQSYSKCLVMLFKERIEINRVEISILGISIQLLFDDYVDVLIRKESVCQNDS
jgi:hypothetical protein